MTKPKKSPKSTGRRATAAPFACRASPAALRGKQHRNTKSSGESALLGEDNLAEDWLNQAEDKAWKSFQ